MHPDFITCISFYFHSNLAAGHMTFQLAYNAMSTMATNTSPYSELPAANSELLTAKARKNLTFEQIGNAIGKDEVWVAAAFYGQAKLSQEELQKLFEVLNISPPEQLLALTQLGDHWYPNRGLGPIPPVDPVIYRLFEGVLVYGHPIKAVIHEKFGDGIMSMIDCKIHVEKKPDPKGDRVLLTFDGKFLPYSQW